MKTFFNLWYSIVPLAGLTIILWLVDNGCKASNTLNFIFYVTGSLFIILPIIVLTIRLNELDKEDSRK